MSIARIDLASAILAALLGAGCGGPTPPVATTPGLEAFVGGRIIDGTGATIDDGVVVVRNGRIEAVGPVKSVAVPADAERIDVSGRTLMPGLINTHGHVGSTDGLNSGPELYTRTNLLRQLGLYARYGVTTVFSLGGDRQAGLDLRNEQDAGLDRARLYVAGPVVTADEVAGAEAVVDTAADMGVDLVKIRVDDNLGTTAKMSAPVYRAVIARAHARGLRVAAHVFYLDDAKQLINAGVDVLAHSVRDTDVDQELIDLLVEHDVCLSPTLMREVSTFVYGSRPDFFDDPFFTRNADPDVLRQLADPERQRRVRESRGARQYRIALDVAARNLKALADGGVRIAFGTDTGPPGRFQGYFEQLELTRMVDAGLTPAQVLASATADAAACMHVADELGTIQPGRWADLVVLTADPLQEIRNTRAIDSVWIAGNRVPGTN